jgi:hypothetical protein
MPSVGFEPATPLFERAKAVHALDRETSVMGLDLWHLVPYSNYTLLQVLYKHGLESLTLVFFKSKQLM